MDNQPQIMDVGPEKSNLCGLEPQLIKLEFIIYLPKLKVSRACRPSDPSFGAKYAPILGIQGDFTAHFKDSRPILGNHINLGVRVNICLTTNIEALKDSVQPF